MSVFSGKAGKGAMKAHRDERYEQAVLRQRALVGAGGLLARERNGKTELKPPAPVEKLLRPGDEVVYVWGDLYRVRSGL